jgi:hypothetical protein
MAVSSSGRHRSNPIPNNAPIVDLNADGSGEEHRNSVLSSPVIDLGADGSNVERIPSVLGSPVLTGQFTMNELRRREQNANEAARVLREVEAIGSPQV